MPREITARHECRRWVPGGTDRAGLGTSRCVQRRGVEESGSSGVVVIGAGAAGLMAAIAAAEAGARVRVLETTADGGRKILISGGGRCNLLPSELHPRQYFTASSPNTLKKLLLSWPLPEQRRYFEDVLGIELALEVESGKLFPASNRARDVRDALVGRARHLGVDFVFGGRARRLERESDGGWRVALEDGAVRATGVIVATGGLSVPQTGSDGWGLRVLEGLGHTINPTHPALTPLTATPPVHAELAGVSLRVRLSAPGAAPEVTAEGGFLFTHRGYSGPSVLNVSHAAVLAGDRSRQPILAAWGGIAPDTWKAELGGGGGGRIRGALRRHLPERLADRLLAEAAVDGEGALSRLRREERARLIEVLTRYPLPWTGDEGYRKAEVTGGGIPLAEVDPRTLESRIAPGLFLCGEILDAFGPIGGYNFAWAWSTGRLAGRSAGGAARAPGRGPSVPGD